MPADIATLDGKDMMAYQGETPWHKLGTKMEGTPDVPAALEAANLNWNVELKSMFYKHKEKTIKVKNRRVVIRDVDGQLLSTVGSDYEPFQNSQAFSILQPACEQFGVTIETAGALGKGDRVWMQAKLPETFEPVKGDKIEGYFLVLNGHNGWTSLSARPTPQRVVCQNTLSMALRGTKSIINLRHTSSGAEQFDQVAKLVTDLIAGMKEANTSFSALAAKKLTQDELVSYISEVLNIELGEEANPVAARRRDTIIELAATGKGVQFAPGTAWTAFNAVTEYIDHVRPAEAKNTRTIAQANQSALFGTNMKIKQRALVLANRLAA
jgi:phage/plasmid-like protein (TIGR03299 family)